MPTAGTSTASRKKSVDSFNELLTLFPLVARQMQGGLEEIYAKFGKSFEKPLPPSPPSSAVPSISSTSSSMGGVETTGVSFAADGFGSSNHRAMKSVTDEVTIRKALEMTVSSAIELFQKVDPSQLSLIASTTDLTGPTVERLIERHVAEHLHDNLLFPRICSTRREEDEELARKIKAMENVDLTQVGIPSLDQKSKLGLVRRLTKGIENFRKIGVAKSPHAMTEILLETAQSLTKIDEIILPSDDNEGLDSEKMSLQNGSTTIVTMNADMLVSLLLIVVIRSKVPHLNACLSYMRNYVFVDNVEQGEIGYILSTLEAVIYHIVQDNDQLSLASSKNRELWRSIRKGNVDGVKSILEPSDTGEQVEGSGDGSSGDSGSYTGYSRSAIEASTNDSPDSSDDEDTIETLPPSVSEADDVNLDAVQNGHAPRGIVVEDRNEDPDMKEENDEHGQKNEQTNEPISNDSSSEGPLTIVGALSEEVVKDMKLLSLDHNPAPVPLMSRGIGLEGDKGTSSENILGSSEMVPNGFAKGKENETYTATDVFTKSNHLPVSASMVSLATTVRDTLSFTQLSRTQTTTSHHTSASQAVDISSVEKLSITRNANGDSIVMMAIQDQQLAVVRYLLDCPYFPISFILDDDNYDGTTLLCAAVQTQNKEIVEVLLDLLLKLAETTLKQYFQRTDNAGRTVGHYLFQ